MKPTSKPASTYSEKQLRWAFRQGFKDGKSEQSQRDFPDVGMRFDREWEDYFEPWKERLDNPRPPRKPRAPKPPPVCPKCQTPMVKRKQLHTPIKFWACLNSRKGDPHPTLSLDRTIWRGLKRLRHEIEEVDYGEDFEEGQAMGIEPWGS